jgi:hypothetical protein
VCDVEWRPCARYWDIQQPNSRTQTVHIVNHGRSVATNNHPPSTEIGSTGTLWNPVSGLESPSFTNFL